MLSSISCSHHGFLRELIKSNLFSAPIKEQNTLFFINTNVITTRQQLFISVSENSGSPTFFRSYLRLRAHGAGRVVGALDSEADFAGSMLN